VIIIPINSLLKVNHILYH